MDDASKLLVAVRQKDLEAEPNCVQVDIVRVAVVTGLGNKKIKFTYKYASQPTPLKKFKLIIGILQDINFTVGYYLSLLDIIFPSLNLLTRFKFIN